MLEKLQMTAEELARWQGRIEAILEERARALELARIEVDRRLGQMNEVREQLASQKSEFASQEKVQGIEERLRILEQRSSMGESASDLKRYLVPVVLTVIFVVIAIIQLVK